MKICIKKRKKDNIDINDILLYPSLDYTRTTDNEETLSKMKIDKDERII